MLSQLGLGQAVVQQHELGVDQKSGLDPGHQTANLGKAFLPSGSSSSSSSFSSSSNGSAPQATNANVKLDIKKTKEELDIDLLVEWWGRTSCPPRAPGRMYEYTCKDTAEANQIMDILKTRGLLQPGKRNPMNACLPLGESEKKILDEAMAGVIQSVGGRLAPPKF